MIRLTVCLSVFGFALAACSSPAITGAAPWKSTSTRLEMSSFGYWVGSSGYAADRAHLSAAQISALNGLRVIPTPSSGAEDIVSWQLTIFDQSGASQTYRAAVDDVISGDESSMPTVPTIGYASLQPFLDTVHCDAAKDPANPSDAGVDAGPPWASAPTLPSDTNCVNGFFIGSPCQDTWRQVVVPQPATYTFALQGCWGLTAIEVLADDGTTELATSPMGASGACASVTYSFAQAGTYLLDVQQRNEAGCDMQTTLGDSAIRITVTQ
jgi:hypothetical protein